MIIYQIQVNQHNLAQNYKKVKKVVYLNLIVFYNLVYRLKEQEINERKRVNLGMMV